MAKHSNAEKKCHIFETFEANYLIELPRNWFVACDTYEIRKGAAVWFINVLENNGANAALTAGLALKAKPYNQDGLSWKRNDYGDLFMNVNCLLRMFETYKTVSDMVYDIFTLHKSLNMIPSN